MDRTDVCFVDCILCIILFVNFTFLTRHGRTMHGIRHLDQITVRQQNFHSNKSDLISNRTQHIFMWGMNPFSAHIYTFTYSISWCYYQVALNSLQLLFISTLPFSVGTAANTFNNKVVDVINLYTLEGCACRTSILGVVPDIDGFMQCLVCLYRRTVGEG